MTDRLPLVRKGGQNVQQPVGDSLRLAGPLNQSDFLTVTAADTTDLTVVQSDNITVTGSGAISSFGSATSGGAFNGARRVVKFSSAGTTISHDPDRLVLFGSSIVTLANDRAEFVYRGTGKWECLWYARADGTSLVGAPFTGGTLTSALNEAPITRLYSQVPVNLGATTSNVVNFVYYDSPVSSFGTAPIGVRRTLIRTGSDQADGVTGAGDSGPITLTHSSALRLPGAANIVMAVGDSAEFESLGSGNWFCTYYKKADGTAVVGAPDPTKLPLAGGQMTGPLNEAYGSAGISSGIITFGADGNSAFVGGSVGDMVYGIADPTVTTLGAVRRIVFVAPGIVLVHSNNLTLPTHANITVQNGDAMIVQADGATAWRCISYQRADGTALASSGSGGASTYTHTQSTAAAVWTIPHNLNRRPSVTVVDTLDNVIVPDISYVDSNTVQVTHGAAYAGKAYLN